MSSAITPLRRLGRRTAGKLQWWAVLATQPQFLVSVVALVQAPDGRILLLENRFWRGNRWGCPAGYMKRGETPEAAARREIREECGIAVRDVRVAPIIGSSRRRVEIWCTARTDLEAAPTALQAWEITGAALLEPEAALARMRRGQAAVVRGLLAARGS